MKLFVALLLLMVSTITFSQQSFNKSKISNEINESVESLVEYGKFNFYYTFPRKPTSPFVVLHSATIEELTELLKHPNPVIRCYAFSELTAHSSVDLLPIILDHLNDNEWVDTYRKESYSYRVGDVFIQLATYENKYMASLTMLQRAKLDRELIFSPNELAEKSFAVERNLAYQTSQHIHDELRKSYLAENNQAALVLLAKYQKKQDVIYIFNNREYRSNRGRSNAHFYYVISKFPHADFISFLEKDLQNYLQNKKDLEWMMATGTSREERELMKAIVSYKDEPENILNILRVPLQTYKGLSFSGGEYIVEMYRKLIHEDPKVTYGAPKVLKTPTNDEILWLFWSEQNIVTEQVFYYLLGKNPKRVFELSLKTVQDEGVSNTDFFHIWNDHGRRPFSSGDRYKFMIKFILKQDKALGIELIRKGISGESENLLLISCSMAAEIKEQSLIAPLETRLKNTTNQYWRKSIIEALSAYEK
ncbi:MAG: hypothetical protein ACKE8G_05475 [Methylophagaceae bacterium]